MTFMHPRVLFTAERYRLCGTQFGESAIGDRQW